MESVAHHRRAPRPGPRADPPRSRRARLRPAPADPGSRRALRRQRGRLRDRACGARRARAPDPPRHGSEGRARCAAARPRRPASPSSTRAGCGNAAAGNLGKSYQHACRPLELLAERMPNTLLLSGAALAAGDVLLAVPLGTISAVYRYSCLDYAATVVAFAGVSIPVFWLAILLIIVFSVTLGWLPSAGMRTVGVPASAGDLLAPPAHAEPRARDVPARPAHALRALEHGRRARAGLHPHRARQGAVRRPRCSRGTRSGTR